MHEAGLISKWKKKWLGSSGTCSDIKITNTTLDLFHFVGLFLLYGVFIVASFVLLLLDILYVKLRNRKAAKEKQNSTSSEECNSDDEVTKLWQYGGCP